MDMATADNNNNSTAVLGKSSDGARSKKRGKQTQDRVLVPQEYFVYVRPAEKSGNSLYRCLNCPPGLSNKTLSCNDISRQNLTKHIEVSN
jgi:hypothetical protein